MPAAQFVLQGLTDGQYSFENTETDETILYDSQQLQTEGFRICLP